MKYKFFIFKPSQCNQYSSMIFKNASLFTHTKFAFFAQKISLILCTQKSNIQLKETLLYIKKEEIYTQFVPLHSTHKEMTIWCQESYFGIFRRVNLKLSLNKLRSVKLVLTPIFPHGLASSVYFMHFLHSCEQRII